MKCLVSDGGGVFGIGQASIYAGGNIDKFDFFAGTSIGAAISIYLALGKDPAKLPVFFNNEMPRIFNGHGWRKFILGRCRYNDKALNKALQELLPGKFGDCKKPCFVTALNLGTKELKVFSSQDISDGDWPAWEVARAAVAAESYFPPWKGFADGGPFANNPSMVAVASASSVLKQDIKKLELFSVGTGYSPDNSKIPTKSWGRIRWALYILDACLSGAASSMHEKFVNSLPLKKHERVQFMRKKGCVMDNAKSMFKAKEAWTSEIKEARKQLMDF